MEWCAGCWSRLCAQWLREYLRCCRWDWDAAGVGPALTEEGERERLLREKEKEKEKKRRAAQRKKEAKAREELQVLYQLFCEYALCGSWCHGKWMFS
jgi:hypothetical protein